MVLRVVASALFVASASGELHCIGRVAHEMVSFQEVGDLSLWPTPERNSECLIQADAGSTKSFCLGVNQNADCSGPKLPSFDMGHGAECKGCFVAARTDLLYSFNTKMWIPQNMSFGFQNTRFISHIEISQAEHQVLVSKEGSKAFLSNPIVAHLPPPISRNITLEMPIGIFYSGLGGAGIDGPVGASFNIEIDNTIIQWVKGVGWSRTFNKPTVTSKPLYLPHDIAADANISVGFNSTLKAQFGEHTWYHAALSASAPMTNDAELLPSERGVHACINMGLNFDMTQEAEASFKLPFIQTNIATKHFGPFVSGIHQPAATHKCIKKTKSPSPSPAEPSSSSAVTTPPPAEPSSSPAVTTPPPAEPSSSPAVTSPPPAIVV